MTHFVYVYSKLGVKGGELESSVASIRKFYRGDDYKIFVIGDDPHLKGGVVHYTCHRIENKRYPKALDAARKLQFICDNSAINEDFIYMYDDILLLKPCTWADFDVVRAMDLVTKLDKYWSGRVRPSSVWRVIFALTLHVLKENGKPQWNYETHLPRVFNKTKLREVIATYKCLDQPRMMATLYFNHFHSAPYEMLKENPSVKCGLYEPHVYQWIEKNVPGHLFLNFDNKGYTEDLQKYIKKKLLAP